MNEQIEIVNPLKNLQWDNLVLSHPDHSFFHSSAWARVLSESYGYTPIYFAVYAPDRLLALMPVMEVSSFLMGRKGVSLPFTDYCDPLVDKGISRQALLEQVIQYGKQHSWKYLELRVGNSLSPATLPSLTYIRHTLDLTGAADQIASRFRSSVKRNIKKAVKVGVEIKITDTLDSVKEYYTLHCITRKKHGLPPQPYEFFENIHRHVIREGFGSVVLASYRGKSIAGSIFFHFGRKAIFKYGASDHTYQSLRANNLVMWAAIRAYAAKGFETLCFGRTDSKNHGLLHFKASWGTTKQLIHYYYYDFSTKSFVIAPLNVTEFNKIILQKIPLSVLKIIGSALYRYAG